MSTYRDPNTVTYDETATTGCKSITINGGGAPQVSRSDAGTFTLFVVSGGVSGTIVYEDPDEAAKVENKTAATKNLTFIVESEVNADKTVTLANFKSGSVVPAYANGAPAGYSVAFVADSVAT